MSGSPVRPGTGHRPSPAVYRRRRLVALLVVLAVLAVAVWGVSALVGRLGGGAAAAGVEAVETTATDVDEEPTPAASPGDCRADDVDLDVVVAPAAPMAGAEVTFDLTLVNSGDQPCLLDAGPAAIAATVTSGSDTVWSSTHCAADGGDHLLLDTGTEHVTTVRWPGTRSTEDCAPNQPVAGAGTYRVTVVHDGAQLSESFTLQPAAAPVDEESEDEDPAGDLGIDPDDAPAD